MSKSDNYREVKNFLENELGINKETIADICTKVIERSVEKHIDAYFLGPSFSMKISGIISQALTKRFYGSLSDDAVREIRKTVNDFLIAEIKAKVGIKAINVQIEEETPPAA